MNCKSCHHEVNLNFCPNCGQPSSLKRIDGHYIIHEIEHVLHFERGILYTVKGLFICPGETIRQYFSENRSRLVKPILFVIITSLIYTFINHFFNIEKGYLSYEGLPKSTVTIILGWMQTHYGYVNILTGVFIAFWMKIFFKKYNFNFYELLVMLCFVLGVSMLIYAFFALLEGITHVKVLHIAGMISIIYLSWATGNFFEKNKLGNYFKAFVSYILGMLVFLVLIMVIGISIDVLLKN